jgi:hypothetical protein
MKKERVYMLVAVHPIKANIWRGIQSGKIKPGMSLREIGKVAGTSRPQQIKHHLEAMRNMGTIDYVAGQYVFEKRK